MSLSRHPRHFTELASWFLAALALVAFAGWMTREHLRERRGRELAEIFAGKAIQLDASNPDSATRWQNALVKTAEHSGNGAAVVAQELQEFAGTVRIGPSHQGRDLVLVDIISQRWQLAARHAAEEAARVPIFANLSLAGCLCDIVEEPEQSRPLLEAALNGRDGSPPMRAELEVRLSLIEKASGRSERAESLVESAVRALDGVGAPGEQALIIALGELEFFADRRGDLARALLVAARRVELIGNQFGRESRLLVPALNNQARYLVGSFKPQAAEPLLRRALAIEERSEPDNATVGWTLAFLGEARRQLRDFKEAEDLLTRSLAHLEKVGGRDSADLITPIFSLAQTHDALGRVEDAIRLYERAAHLERLRGDRATPRLGSILDRLGMQYFVRGRQREAEAALQEAFDFLQSRGLLDRPEHCRTAADLGRVLLAGTRPEEAEAFVRRTVAAIDKMPSAFPPGFVVEVRTLLARTILRQGFTDEAETLLREIVRFSEANLAGDAVRLSGAHLELGNALVSARRSREAEECYTRALAVAEKTHGPDNPVVAAPLTALGALLVGEGRVTEGTRLLQRAAELVQKHPGVPPAFTLSLLNQLGNAARKQNDDALADQLFSFILLGTERIYGSHDPRLIGPLTARAIVRHKHTADAAAEADLVRAVQIAVAHQARTGERFPETDACLQRLRDFLRATGRGDAAIEQKVNAALGR